MNADASTTFFLGSCFWNLMWISAFNIFSVRKLAENCCKYGVENKKGGSALARAVLQFGTSHSSMEDERETLLEILSNQVVPRLYLTI